mgnify:CR=1 FL=1
MQFPSQTLEQLVNQFARFPGIGKKTALRMALFMLKQPDNEVREMGEVISTLKENIKYCHECGNVSDNDPCTICSNVKRENGQICVVEEFNDVYIIEKTNEFRGRYHVLGGVISPMDNIGPDQLRIQELLKRVGGEEQINEVILALNPDAEGEATSYYINKLLLPYEVKVTRIAYGIPMGTELEFIDEATLSRAFTSRSSF